MNIENLIRKAVDRIKETWGLPERGFIAGGSIANLVWEMVSGNKAVVNDVDVFLFDGIISNIDPTDKSSLFKYEERETKYWEDYTGMRYSSINKDFYTIESSEHDGIFNKVKYKSNKPDTDIILRSFDINATKVGYSIEEDKIYWTSEFEEFLKSGELLVCNVMTPCHTAIRIVKKQQELNCKLKQFEIDILKHSIEARFNDAVRYKFKSRYFELYEKYKDILQENFVIKRDPHTEDYIRLNFNEDTQIYYLEPIIEQDPKKLISENHEFVYGREVFEDDNIRRIGNTQIFLFYVRNIYKKDNLPELWSKLHFYFNDISYIDCQPTNEELDLLNRLAKNAPNSIENLRGKKLSEQISLVKWILEKYHDDPIIAISILEKHKLSQKELDDEDLLLLELSVRRQIVNDTKGKVNKVLGKNESPINNTHWWLD